MSGDARDGAPTDPPAADTPAADTPAAGKPAARKWKIGMRAEDVVPGMPAPLGTQALVEAQSEGMSPRQDLEPAMAEPAKDAASRPQPPTRLESALGSAGFLAALACSLVLGLLFLLVAIFSEQRAVTGSVLNDILIGLFLVAVSLVVGWFVANVVGSTAWLLAKRWIGSPVLRVPFLLAIGGLSGMGVFRLLGMLVDSLGSDTGSSPPPEGLMFLGGLFGLLGATVFMLAVRPMFETADPRKQQAGADTEPDN